MLTVCEQGFDPGAVGKLPFAGSMLTRVDFCGSRAPEPDMSIMSAGVAYLPCMIVNPSCLHLEDDMTTRPSCLQQASAPQLLSWLLWMVELSGTSDLPCLPS